VCRVGRKALTQSVEQVKSRPMGSSEISLFPWQPGSHSLGTIVCPRADSDVDAAAEETGTATELASAASEVRQIHAVK